MAQALRELGHEVTVLTTNASGTLDSDSPWVIRTGDLQASPALRRVLGRPPLEGPSGAESPAVLGADAPEPSPIFTRGLVPDSWVLTWLPYVVPAARRLIRQRHIEAVVTNGPPDSTHLVGLALGRRRPAWIADFDDGWRFEPLMGSWPTTLQDRLDAALEKRVATSAEALVGITEAIAADFTARYGSLAYEIPSGWDPVALDAKTASVAAPELDPGVVHLVHTGSLSIPERRDPRGLFQALETLVREEPELGRRLGMSLAGALTGRDRRMLDDLSPAVQSMVNELGPLPQPEALALQRAADYLLLVSTGPHRQVVTAKLSEYLLAKRPILAVLSENEAARIIRETHTGVVVAPDDLDGLRSALRSCLDGRLAESYEPTGLERYVQPGPAQEFAAVIDGAIARRAARAGSG